MSGTPLVFVFLTLAASVVLHVRAEEYPMGDIPSNDQRWKKVLGQINASRLEKAGKAEKTAAKLTVEILQHIDGSSYLARIRTPVGLAESAASGISRGGTAVGGWETVRLDLPKSSLVYADGETFLWPIETTGAMFQYTTALGAKATIKVCRIVGTGAEYDRLTMEEFVSKLKAGETWEIAIDQVTTQCKFCRGAKELNGGVCRQCDGKGGETIRRHFRVRW